MRLRNRVLRIALMAIVVAFATTLVRPGGPATAQQLPPCITNTALPDAIKIGQPGVDAPPELSGWLGAFEGVWQVTSSRLLVERIDGTKAHVVYMWGDEATGDVKAGFRRHTVDLMADGSIQWAFGSLHFAFHLDGDTVSGAFTRQATVYHTTMQRCAMTTAAEPPELMAAPSPSAVVIEDKLASPGVASPRTCPTGRMSGVFVDEGYLFKISGRCQDDQNFTSAGTAQVSGLQMRDGEARFDYKPTVGRDRLRVRLGFRLQPNPGNNIGYAFRITPGTGTIDLLKQTAPNQSFVLDERNDLAARLATEDWVTVTVRARGPNLWMLLNDEPVLAAYDTTFESGGVNIGYIRLGNFDDPAESAVVLRNFRFSSLAP